LLQFTLIPLLNVAAAALESVSGSSSDQLAANFSAFARK
jgi:hypothetical protein